MKIFSAVIFATFSILLSDCRDKGTEPCANCPDSGKRDYVWTVDTLSYPGSLQTNMQAMWASSPNNVYVVGHNDLGRGQMFHYDGIRWKVVPLSVAEGGTINKSIDLHDIHGISSSEIWAVGAWLELVFDSASGQYSILHHSFTMRGNGISWREFPVMGGGDLYSVWVNSATDAWAVGENGIILRFNGSAWIAYYVGDTYFLSSVSGTSASDMYAMGHRSDSAPPIDSSGSYLFHFDGLTWNTVDSAMATPSAPPADFGTSGIWANSSTVYTLGQGIYRRQGNTWVKICSVEAGQMYSSSADNIVAVGRSVYNFNGSEWKEYVQFNNWSTFGWFDCFTDGHQAFVVGNNNALSVILQGRR